MKGLKMIATVFAIIIYLASITAAQEDGCVFYEKNNRRGDEWRVKAGKGYKFVGSKWNDRISSVYIAKGFVAYLYTHRDYRGRSEVFYPNEISSTGRYMQINLDQYNFNDEVSSFKCLRQ